MLSRPIGIEWGGWRSTTVELQHAGWDLAVSMEHGFRVDAGRYTLLMRHEKMDLYAISDPLTLEMTIERWPEGDRYPIFHVVQVAHKFRTAAIAMADWSSFQQIDAKTRIVETPIKNIEDFNIFALARSSAEEIMVNRADMTVVEHLEAIKKLQEPKQAELSKASLDARARPQLVAQLIHIAA